MHYIRAALYRLAATRTFTYLYDNRRAQNSTWQQGRDGAQSRAVPADGVIRDVICSEENKRKRKEKGDTRLYARHDSELDGLTMKLSTTKRRQQPIVREDICGGDIDAEKRGWNTGNSVIQEVLPVFTNAAGECNWSMIVDLTVFVWITVFLSTLNVCLNKHDLLDAKQKVVNGAKVDVCTCCGYVVMSVSWICIYD